MIEILGAGPIGAPKPRAGTQTVNILEESKVNTKTGKINPRGIDLLRESIPHLTTTELNNILARLKKGGTQILIPSPQIMKLRAEKGLPETKPSTVGEQFKTAQERSQLENSVLTLADALRTNKK